VKQNDELERLGCAIKVEREAFNAGMKRDLTSSSTRVPPNDLDSAEIYFAKIARGGEPRGKAG
jgi:hypothetical protein